MSDYKLVPVEPTPEMVEAAESAHMPFGDMDMAIRMALLAAPDHITDAGKMVASAVQSEPASGVVLSRDDLIQCLLATRGQSEGTTADAILSMIAAAPAAQGEPVAWSLRFRHGDKYERVGPISYMTTFGSKKDADIYANRVASDIYGNPKPERRPVVVPLYTAPQPAPELSKFLEKEEWNDAFAQGFNAGFNSDEKPAPDVAGLMGVLGQYFDAMDAIGREGTATSSLIAEAECDEAEARLRLFLATHRKGGDV